MADQLKLSEPPDAVWSSARSATMNLEWFLVQVVLDEDETPLVWAMDEADRLFTVPYGADLFALFRSWHNRRSLDPMGAWQNLTLLIAHATAPHLFLEDLNQSPFNIGTRFTLDDFSRSETEEMNRRMNRPLQTDAEIDAFRSIVGAHPHLSHIGMAAIAARRIALGDLNAEADRGEEGIFHNHLRRLLHSLNRDARLADVLRRFVHGQTPPTQDDLFRLRAAGILRGDTPASAKFRCDLYRLYFSRLLPPSDENNSAGGVRA